MQARFESLLEGNLGILFKVVRTYSRQPDDQLDLAQEIKLQLWSAFQKYDEKRLFSTWMYRIALNTAISWTRRTTLRDRHSAPYEEARDRAVPVEQTDEQRILDQLIDGLDRMNRALLLLYLDDLSHAEIGEILGLTPGNVATKLSRIKEQLRQQLNSKEEN